MSYRFVDNFRAGPGWDRVPSWCYLKAVWHIPLLSVQWIDSWWWTEELSDTCRVSCQNKFVKLVHLVGFITKKFVTMRGHMNVKLLEICYFWVPRALLIALLYCSFESEVTPIHYAWRCSSPCPSTPLPFPTPLAGTLYNKLRAPEPEWQ